MRKIFIFLALLVTSFFSVSAHEFDDEAFLYILGNPDATMTEFTQYLESTKTQEEDYSELFEDAEDKLSSILSLPGKKYVVNYAKKNPDFSYWDIEWLIQDDPMLSEIGSEQIYLFLSQVFQEDTEFSWSLFSKIVKEWFNHILWGTDHILFLILLIISISTLRAVFYIATVFSVSHSIALVLSGLEIVTPPSIYVETGIVLSIIFLWLFEVFKIQKNVRLPEEKRESQSSADKKLYILVFALWLIHWLGFAWFFKDMMQVWANPLSLILWFNIWVELGQIIILLIGSAVTFVLYKYFSKYRDHMKQVVCTAIILYAMYLLYGMYM